LPKEGGSGEGKVLSFGHNFRYRWKHLDDVTVRVIAYDTHAHRWDFERRPELRAHPEEAPDEEGRPQKLSKVRAMLGYVVADKDGRNPSMGGAGRADKERLNLLADPFDRLAGRVSFNVALERVSRAQANTDDRFVQGAAGAYVFLHPMSTGKTSSFGTYVPGNERSWGDGLAHSDDDQQIWVQNGTALFACRKFYAHQGYDENGGEIALPQHHFDLVSLLQQPNRAGLTATSEVDLEKFLPSDQARLSAGISRAGTEFGCTVRFKDLRSWELAALVAVLEPGRLARVWKEHGRPVNGNWFANKLGGGRALGLGSVQISIDRALRWSQAGRGDDAILDGAALDKLLTKLLKDQLDPQVVSAWLDAHRVDRGDERRPYLLHRSECDPVPETATGFNHRWRKKHSKLTRTDGLVRP